MNEDSVLIALDMIKKKVCQGNVEVATTLIAELESKLETSKAKSNGTYQIVLLQPLPDKIYPVNSNDLSTTIEMMRIKTNEIISTVNQLINESNKRRKIQ